MEKKFKIDQLVSIIDRYAFDEHQMGPDLEKAIEIMWHLGLLKEERLIPPVTWLGDIPMYIKEEATQPSASTDELQRTLDI